MSNQAYPTKACHNCRRQRLRCDRSYPQCHKCIRTSQECLGYGNLFRWNKGVASRGKMMGLKLEDTYGTQKEDKQVLIHYVKHAAPAPDWALIDPIFKDLDQESRCYLYYFAENVCKDLVCYDIPNHNLFRDLIPLTRGHPALYQIIIAISALHMCNASQRSARKPPSRLLHLRTTSCHATFRTPSPSAQQSKWYKEALTAKHTALRFLRQALEGTQSSNLEIILATVVLFVEFELIDSGRDDWRFHINGAKGLIDSLQSSCTLGQANATEMRNCLISNCAVYDILGSALAHSIPYKYPNISSTQLFSALESTETNNYLCCPAILLQLVLTATKLSHSHSLSPQDLPNHPTKPPTSTPAQQISHLLLTARSFDAVLWATSLQKLSPHPDISKRIHIASAHRAAVCIYISRASSLFTQTLSSSSLESLVLEIIHHLSFIISSSGLFKATSWPAFIAGIETEDVRNQEWAIERLYELWDFCPWGYIQSAVKILDMVWGERDRVVGAGKGDGRMNWLKELRELGVDWLIA